MTRGVEAVPGGVCWIDLGVADTDIAADFYSRLFGWYVIEPDNAGYRIALLDGHPVAAFGPAEDPGPPYWTVYLHTADIAASIRAVIALGGAIVAPPAESGDAGTAAVVRSPEGIRISLWQPGTHLGTLLDGAHGTVAGVQLCADNPADVAGFLQGALGWSAEPTWLNRPSLHVIRRHGPVRRDWLVHFSVEDPAAAGNRALSLGADPVAGESDVFVDPSGATFALLSRRRVTAWRGIGPLPRS